MKMLKKHTKNMLLIFRKRVLDIWLKDVIVILLLLLKQMSPRQMGKYVLCHFKYKEWKAVTFSNRNPPCSSVGELKWCWRWVGVIFFVDLFGIWVRFDWLGLIALIFHILGMVYITQMQIHKLETGKFGLTLLFLFFNL